MWYERIGEISPGYINLEAQFIIERVPDMSVKARTNEKDSKTLIPIKVNLAMLLLCGGYQKKSL